MNNTGRLSPPLPTPMFAYVHRILCIAPNDYCRNVLLLAAVPARTAFNLTLILRVYTDAMQGWSGFSGEMPPLARQFRFVKVKDPSIPHRRHRYYMVIGIRFDTTVEHEPSNYIVQGTCKDDEIQMLIISSL